MIPKFRAWLKDEKKMIDVISIDFRIEEIACFGIQLKNINIYLCRDIQNNYEVIGNIYDNPELLGGRNE